MSILSTNHRLISIGESYSAGSGIDITDQIISVTGDAMPYSAGENIDIQGHVISGKDWSQEITDASSNAFNETTAWVHDNYANSADVSYLSGVVDNKLDASAWSTVSGDFATEDYVIMADNITYDRTTGYVENQQFAKESACQSAFEQLNTNKLDASSFTDWQNGQYSTDLQTIEGQIANKLDTSSFSEVSGDFQPRGDYVERNTVYSAIESATSGKLDVSSFASVSSDFLTTSFGISESATWNETSDVVQTNSASWADGGSGDEEVNSFVYNNSATINEVNTAYQTHSASYQPSGNYIPYTGYSASLGYVTNSSFTIHDGSFTNSLGRGTIVIQNRISSNIYSNMAAGPASISFSTPSDSAQVDISSINKWNDTSTTVQSNSAQWAEGGAGDTEVNELVHSNSGTWNTVTNKLDTTAQVVTGYTTATIEGTNAINSLNGKPIISFRTQSAQEAGIADKARYDFNGNNLADDHNSLTALNNVVQTNSAQWAEGGSVPVSNSGDLYKVEFDGVDLYGYKSTTTIPTEPFYSAVSSQESTYIQHTPYPQWNNNAIQDLHNWSAFNIISISSNGNGIRPVGYPYGVTALDVYYQAKYVFDYNENQLPDFSGYVGQITLDNLFISSYFDKPSYYDNIARCSQFRLWFSGNDNEGQLNNNHYICSVGTEVQSDPETVEGIFVPSATDLSNYYTKSETSGASEIADALANIPTGNPEVESYVQTNSANIDDTVTSYQTNSGDYLKESELGYNAVDEVSAINGSAISQYGAEKQWLVHDDTLVHASNSAQYALGVNLSAVAQLLGVDETVLWSGSEYLSASPVITASDYFTNYNKINFYIKTHSTVNDIHIDSHESTTGNGTEERYDIFSVGLLAGNGAGMRFNHACLTALPHTKEFHVTGVGQHTLTGTSVQTAACPSLLVKIVGIGRK